MGDISLYSLSRGGKGDATTSMWMPRYGRGKGKMTKEARAHDPEEETMTHEGGNDS